MLARGGMLIEKKADRRWKMEMEMKIGRWEENVRRKREYESRVWRTSIPNKGLKGFVKRSMAAEYPETMNAQTYAIC